MTRRLMLTLLTAAMCSVALPAADISGKWTAQVPSRGGELRETTFDFKQDGSKLSGSVAAAQVEMKIDDGKVDGDSVSFSVTQTTGGNTAKVLFKGTIAGAEIKFTRQREGGEARPFTAKRAGS